MLFKNITKGPRGLNTKTGSVFLAPGESADLDLIRAELDIARATGWWEIGGSSAAVVEEDETTDEVHRHLVEGDDEGEGEGDGDETDDEIPDFAAMKVDEIKAWLTEYGVDYTGVTRKDDLVQLANDAAA